MDELISKRAAIDALWKALFEYEDKIEKQFQEAEDLDVGDWIGHGIFVQNMNDIDRQTILNLPSAQPDVPDTNVGDTISRQAAIDALCAVCGKACDKSEFVYNAPQDEQVILCPEHYCLCTLPPAQPDLSGYSDKLWKATYERGKAEAEQRGILWEKLERYAEFFCADVPYTEFVREAKQFFLDAERSEE